MMQDKEAGQRRKMAGGPGLYLVTKNCFADSKT
jgi:hypothetical protein